MTPKFKKAKDLVISINELTYKKENIERAITSSIKDCRIEYKHKEGFKQEVYLHDMLLINDVLKKELKSIDDLLDNKLKELEEL